MVSDTRFDFLRSTADRLPVDVSVAYAPEGKRGPAAMHYWPPRQGTAVPPDNLLFFILGNPGVLDYYTPFLELLRSQLPEGHGILCTSHVGGDPRLPGPATPLDLTEHLETKIETVQALRAALNAWAQEKCAPTPKLTLMGHSVGGWLVTEVMRQIDVDAGYLLFPTLGWIANSPNGWKLWPIFHRPVRPLLPLLSRISAPVLGPLASLLGLPAPTRSLIKSPDTITHVLAMARSEMLTIRRPELEWYYTQRERPPSTGVYGVWSANGLDGWVGDDGPLVRECLGPKRSIELEGVPHAFCLHEKDYTQVADIVARWITDGTENDTMNGYP